MPEVSVGLDLVQSWCRGFAQIEKCISDRLRTNREVYLRPALHKSRSVSQTGFAQIEKCRYAAVGVVALVVALILGMVPGGSQEGFRIGGCI